VTDIPKIVVKPLTPENWSDMGAALGVSGDGGCWCMWWRLSDDEYEEQRGETNRLAMKKLVDAGKTPGVIAYLNNQPAGWCAIGPREEYTRLERSSLLTRVDNEPVWSIVCYYIKPSFRGRGLMEYLTRGAVDLARSKGIRVVEAYPVELTPGSSPAGAYTGVAAVLRKVGFFGIGKPPAGRPIMRYDTQVVMK
jgi:predicted GNAT family acetyltransferase